MLTPDAMLYLAAELTDSAALLNPALGPPAGACSLRQRCHDRCGIPGAR
jgi:hypothetical protein